MVKREGRMEEGVRDREEGERGNEEEKCGWVSVVSVLFFSLFSVVLYTHTFTCTYEMYVTYASHAGQ